MTDLAEFTTLRVGGPARELVSVSTRDDLVSAARSVWASGEQWFALGGGSNVVVADSGFDGSVIRILTRGITEIARDDSSVTLRVEAGEPWDDLVALTVARGLAGIEALSGIPGSTGAAPIQNIGAYGQEIGDALVSIEFLDYETGELSTLPAADLGLGYRTSAIKRGRSGLVVSVDLRLADDAALSRPVAYDQLATALGVEVGARVPVADVRARVLELRASKGMVLDPHDADSVSAGSFFTNPIVSTEFASDLPARAPRWPLGSNGADGADTAMPSVKLSAAWLIERAGISRGFALPGSRAAISSKHTLAITNRGGATAAEITELARFVQERVRNEFGVALHPEPVYVGEHG